MTLHLDSDYSHSGVQLFPDMLIPTPSEISWEWQRNQKTASLCNIYCSEVGCFKYSKFRSL